MITELKTVIALVVPREFPDALSGRKLLCRERCYRGEYGTLNRKKVIGRIYKARPDICRHISQISKNVRNFDGNSCLKVLKYRKNTSSS